MLSELHELQPAPDLQGEDLWSPLEFSWQPWSASQQWEAAELATGSPELLLECCAGQYTGTMAPDVAASDTQIHSTNASRVRPGFTAEV